MPSPAPTAVPANSPPTPATAAALVEGWPGPALLVTAGAGLTAASAEGRALVQADGPAAAWRQALFAWLNGGAAPVGSTTPSGMTEDDRRPDRHVSAIPEAGGMRLVEWTAIALPDNTVGLLGRDVTLERALHGALVDSRQRLRDLVDLAADVAFEIDGDGCFAWLSADPLPGRRADALIGRPAGELTAGSGLARTVFESRHRQTEVPAMLADAHGQPVPVTVTVRPRADADGRWVGTRGLIRWVDRPAIPSEAEPGAGPAGP
jgi:PAS domain-containing protein